MKNILLALAALSSFRAFAGTSYVVREGDTILKISDRTLGIDKDKKDPRRYEFAREILAGNPELKDPNVLTPGQSLNIPDTRKPSATAEATPVPVKVEEPTKPEVPVTPATEAPAAKVEAPAPAAPVAPAVTEEPKKAAEPEKAPEPKPTLSPVVVAAPSPAVAPEIEHHETERDFLIVQPRTQFDHFKIKNEEAEKDFKLNSQTNVGLGLTYGSAISESAHFLAQVGVNYVRLQNLTGEDETFLDGRNQWVKNFGVGVEWHAMHDLRVEAMAFYKDRLFVLPTEEVDHYQIKNIAVPGAELALKYDLFHLGKSAFGLGVAGEYLGAVNKDGLKYKATIDPVGSLYWESECVGVTLYYAPNAQHPEGMEQELETLGVNLNLTFAL